MLLNRLNTEFNRFVVVGVINTITYYSIYLMLHKWAELSYLSAHVLGFLISLNVSFFLNSYVTYKVKPTFKKYLLFPLTQLVNMSVSTILIYVFVEFFHLSSSIAPFAAVLFTVPITFLVSTRIMKGPARSK